MHSRSRRQSLLSSALLQAFGFILLDLQLCLRFLESLLKLEYSADKLFSGEASKFYGREIDGKGRTGLGFLRNGGSEYREVGAAAGIC